MQYCDRYFENGSCNQNLGIQDYGLALLRNNFFQITSSYQVRGFLSPAILKKMKCESIFVILSSLISVTLGDEENTIRTLWEDEILDDQTKAMQAFFESKLAERDSKIDELTNAVNEMKKEFRVR